MNVMPLLAKVVDALGFEVVLRLHDERVGRAEQHHQDHDRVQRGVRYLIAVLLVLGHFLLTKVIADNYKDIFNIIQLVIILDRYSRIKF